MAGGGKSNGEGGTMFIVIILSLAAIYAAYHYGYLQEAARWLVAMVNPRWQ